MEGKKPSFQKPLTIEEVVNGVYKKDYVLPAIQREFVWTTQQITTLFDSLMKNYPIGSFLFWEVDKENIKNFQFYEFIRNYHERDGTHNPKADTIGDENVNSILDGQQRLTSLYIALKGTYSEKIPKKRWDNNDAFPPKKLFLNLLSQSEDYDKTYDFKFLNQKDAEYRDNNTFWFEVGKIIDFKSIVEIFDYLREIELIQDKFASKCLCDLWEIITQKETINYYLETSQQLDKVLNIFIRVNSGGTQLSYSDLLLSIATAEWKERDAREEINSFVDEINKIGDGFTFDKDFVLKNCLVLSDIKDIAFKVDNFNTKNMKLIESNWEEIKKSIRLAVELISSFRYNYQNLTSSNALIPISYYLFKLGNPENFVLSQHYKTERDNIKQWLILSLLKRVFSGQPDNILRPIRKLINENGKEFPFEKIVNNFKGNNKSIIFTEDDIDELMYCKYGKPHTYSALLLLYPTLDLRNKFHQDHMQPKSFFNKRTLIKKGINEEKQQVFLNNYNSLANLQLLEGIPNEEKSNKELIKWINDIFKSEEEKKEYYKKHYIPEGISLEFENFEEFFDKRYKLIKDKFKEILLN